MERFYDAAPVEAWIALTLAPDFRLVHVTMKLCNCNVTNSLAGPRHTKCVVPVCLRKFLRPSFITECNVLGQAEKN